MKPSQAPRIVCLGAQGWSALRVSQFIGCSESYAANVLLMWRSEGGKALVRLPRQAKNLWGKATAAEGPRMVAE